MFNKIGIWIIWTWSWYINWLASKIGSLRSKFHWYLIPTFSKHFRIICILSWTRLMTCFFNCLCNPSNLSSWRSKSVSRSNIRVVTIYWILTWTRHFGETFSIYWIPFSLAKSRTFTYISVEWFSNSCSYLILTGAWLVFVFCLQSRACFYSKWIW